MIPRNELIADLERVQADISDEYRAYEDDDEPGIQYTLGSNDDQTEYASQMGDNSFTGAAYSFPHWGVVGVYRDSDIPALADDLLEQIAELIGE